MLAHKYTEHYHILGISTRQQYITYQNTVIFHGKVTAEMSQRSYNLQLLITI